jgi:hypothetical protein
MARLDKASLRLVKARRKFRKMAGQVSIAQAAQMIEELEDREREYRLAWYGKQIER